MLIFPVCLKNTEGSLVAVPLGYSESVLKIITMHRMPEADYKTEVAQIEGLHYSYKSDLIVAADELHVRDLLMWGGADLGHVLVMTFCPHRWLGYIALLLFDVLICLLVLFGLIRNSKGTLIGWVLSWDHGHKNTRFRLRKLFYPSVYHRTHTHTQSSGPPCHYNLVRMNSRSITFHPSHK